MMKKMTMMNNVEAPNPNNPKKRKVKKLMPKNQKKMLYLEKKMLIKEMNLPPVNLG